MASRYGVTKEDIQNITLALKIGDGQAQRFTSTIVDIFIERADDWAEGQSSEFIGVPLKATPAPGEATVPGTPTKDNYPEEFIQAIMYWAAGRMLQSDYHENSPNVSAAGEWAESVAYQHIEEFRSRSTVRVGAGRRRHPNVHMPPNIAPREELPGGTQRIQK